MGSLFSNLTKSGVQNPDGQTNYFDNPAQAGKALASASAATSQPGTSSVEGNIGAPNVSTTQLDPGGIVGPRRDDVTTVTPGVDKTDVTRHDAPVSAQPKMTHTTWAQAQSSKDPSALLTTKGKVLNTLLQAGIGALAGDAAARDGDPRHGYPGLGSAGMAGVNTVFAQQQRKNALIQRELEQEKERAQIAALPLQANAKLAETNAHTDYLNAGADTRGTRKVGAGDTVIDREGTILHQGMTPEDIAKEKQTGKEAATTAALKASGATPDQVLSALGVKPNKQNTSVAQMYLDKNNGDSAAAIKQMNADRVANSAAIHASIAKLHSVDSSDTPAMRANVNSDPQYSGLKKQRDTMLTRLATMETNGADPLAVSKMQSQADALTQKMVNRRSKITSKPGATNSLPLNGGTVRMTGPGGAFDVPAYKVEKFKANGYQ